MSYFTTNTTALPYGTYNPQRNGINHLQQPQIPGIVNQGPPHDANSNAAQQSQLQQNQSPQINQTQGNSPTQDLNNDKSGKEQMKKERKNRPGHKFGAKKKSWVWTWFVQDTNNPNIAACDYCGKILIRLASDKGSPKKLSEHLKTHKLTRETINYSRSIPLDGYGVTYTNNGDPISYPSNYQEPHAVAAAATAADVNANIDAGHLHSLESTKKMKGKGKMGPDPNEAFNAKDNRRFLSADFDNTPYTSMKFHKHLMKFLTDNKLPINVIKSHSFQQLIYDLRSDSVADLLELTSLYSSLLEVSRYGDGSVDSTAHSEVQAVNALASVVENKMNG